METKDLWKSFGGLVALRNANVSVNKGEIIGLIGPNGSGKTTLFNVITGFYKPERGAVLFQGKKISGQPPHAICKKGIARTFQIVKPFGDLTVLENVAVGALVKTKNLEGARRKAADVLKFTGLYPKHNILARSLTLAERKRLEISRALATDPVLLLLDEAMAGLNPVEIDEALKLIREIRERGITIVIVEHVMRAIMRVSERIFVLHHGEKIAEGRPEEVAKMEHVIAAYLGRGL